jgi:hypothetical protein
MTEGGLRKRIDSSVKVKYYSYLILGGSTHTSLRAYDQVYRSFVAEGFPIDDRCFPGAHIGFRIVSWNFT